MATISLEGRVTRVLKETGITAAPVPVHLVAQRLGLLLESVPLGDEVSGVLVIDGGHGVIGYNAAHPPARQRFTIAHEIGHYIMHRNDAALFIDQRFFATFRDTRSSRGSDKREREANAFAASLLMPTQLVLTEISHRDFDLGGEDGLTDLAQAFQVSVQAMVYRLTNMGVLSPTTDLRDLFAERPHPKARAAVTKGSRPRR
jgi:Zn-dependent peptidase ImmA (M78 family)